MGGRKVNVRGNDTMSIPKMGKEVPLRGIATKLNTSYPDPVNDTMRMYRNCGLVNAAARNCTCTFPTFPMQAVNDGSIASGTN